MPDPFRLGKDAKVYRNTGAYGAPTWVEVSIIMDNTLNLEKGEFDGSTRGTGGWRQKAGTLKDGSVEMKILHKPTDTHILAFMDGYLNGTNVDLMILDGSNLVQGNSGLRAEMQVMSMSRGEPLEEGQTWDVKVTPGISGNAPVWYTVP